MIRITVITQTHKEVILKIEGWLVEGEALDLVEQEGERHLQQTERLVLDLAGVRYIDKAGIRLLQGWKGERLVVRGASPFLQALLETHGLM